MSVKMLWIFFLWGRGKCKNNQSGSEKLKGYNLPQNQALKPQEKTVGIYLINIFRI